MRKRNNRIRRSALLLAVFFCLSAGIPVLAAEDMQKIYIRSAEDLLELAQNCSLDTWSQDKTVILDADIALDHTELLPIPSFGGCFDGNGHTISGLRIDSGISPAGLFGVLQENAVVKDLHVPAAHRQSGSSWRHRGRKQRYR